MAVAIPNFGWSPRRDPLTKARIEDRGKTCARKFTLPMHRRVPETPISLTGGKPASSVRELPPP